MKHTIHVLYVTNGCSLPSAIIEILNNEFEIKIANNENEAWRLFQDHSFDLLLVNQQYSTSGQNDIEQIRLMRCTNTFIPIVIFNPLASKDDVIHSLAAGADDFIPPNISPQEFIARLQATFRRSNEYNRNPEQNNLFRISKITTLNSITQILTIGEITIHLTSMENKLLKILVLHINQCVTKKELIEELWKSSEFEKNAYLDKYLVKVRKHLQKDPTLKIINTWGEGFCLSNQP